MVINVRHKSTPSQAGINIFLILSCEHPETIERYIKHHIRRTLEKVGERGDESPERKNSSRFAWTLDQNKYLDERQVRRLRKVMLRERDRALRKRAKTPVYDWFLVELALFTGMRVMEISQLQWRDIIEKDGVLHVQVRNGKNGKKRVVLCSDELRSAVYFFRRWKNRHNESTEEEAPLFYSRRTGGSLSKRALQQSFKRSIHKAGLSRHYSIHCLRHTYGTHLLKASNWNLRFVQQQLGHSSIGTTEVYAKVMVKDGKKAVYKLYRKT